MKINSLKVRNDKPLQQYFKPLIIDHLSFIHNEKQCQPSSFKNSKYCDRGKKVSTHQVILRKLSISENLDREVKSNKYIKQPCAYIFFCN